MNKQRTFYHALHEWITRIANFTRTSHCVIHHFAFSIVSTGSWAGIFTFHVYTGFFRRTIRIDQTLRPTWWRNADVCGQTRTWWLSICVLTKRVWSAWRRIARIPLIL